MKLFPYGLQAHRNAHNTRKKLQTTRKFVSELSGNKSAVLIPQVSIFKISVKKAPELIDHFKQQAIQKEIQLSKDLLIIRLKRLQKQQPSKELARVISAIEEDSLNNKSLWFAKHFEDTYCKSNTKIKRDIPSYASYLAKRLNIDIRRSPRPSAKAPTMETSTHKLTPVVPRVAPQSKTPVTVAPPKAAPAPVETPEQEWARNYDMWVDNTATDLTGWAAHMAHPDRSLYENQNFIEIVLKWDKGFTPSLLKTQSDMRLDVLRKIREKAPAVATIITEILKASDTLSITVKESSTPTLYYKEGTYQRALYYALKNLLGPSNLVIKDQKFRVPKE